MSEIRFLPQSSVIWGKDVVAPALRQVREQFTQKPILFSIPELVRVLEETVAPGLGKTCSRYLDFPPHVPDFAVEAALGAAKSAGAGLIVACGGGSVLDAAKAVSHAHHLETGSFLPIVALPTTLSGSEFSHYFGITETSGGTRFKRSYAVRDTTPRHVIIDPDLIAALPGYICKDELADRRLVQLMPGWITADARMSAVMPHREGLPPAVRALVDFLAAEIPKITEFSEDAVRW